MSEMKRLFESTSYTEGYSDASSYFKQYRDKLIAINEAITDMIDIPTNDSSYTYGYLVAISKVLGDLIDEARNETIITYIKEHNDE